jgi:hypothetical protein
MAVNVGDPLPDSIRVEQTSMNYTFIENIPLTNTYDNN